MLGSNQEPSFLNLTLFFTFLFRYGPPRSYIPFNVCLSRAGGLICQNLFLVIVQGAIDFKILSVKTRYFKLFLKIMPTKTTDFCLKKRLFWKNAKYFGKRF